MDGTLGSWPTPSPSEPLSAIGWVLLGVVIGVLLQRGSRGIAKVEHRGHTRTGSRIKTRQLFQCDGWEGTAGVSDWGPFRLLGRSMVDYIMEYFQEIHTRPVRALVEPGYLKERLTQTDFPQKGERWSAIMADVDAHVMPGITHWQHPRFFAYYPANTSPPALLADMLSSMLNVISFSWEASPAATELEVHVMELLRRAIGLPEAFSYHGQGGGVIQTTACEGTLVALLAARERALRHMKQAYPDMSDRDLVGRMTIYCSDQAHTGAKKAAIIAGMVNNLRTLPTRSHEETEDEPYALEPSVLAAAMRADHASGLVPIFVFTTVGTTNSCAVDPLRAIGEVCRGERGAWRVSKNGGSDLLVPWLHVDAAYAGTAAVCPENRWILDGVEYVDSFLFNPHKWLLASFDLSAMWVKRKADIVKALSITPEVVMSKEYELGLVSDFKDWQVPLGRKFRALKIWFIFRAYGLDKIQDYIRRHQGLARLFEALVRGDDRFEIVRPARLGLVCLRLKGTDAANDELRSQVITSGEAFFSATTLAGRLCLRVAVGGHLTEEKDVRELWAVLQKTVNSMSQA